MSHITTLAERIKVITTIRKTAHAMQLISMSTLSRIGNKKKALKLYTDQLEKLIQELGLGLGSGVTKKPVYLIIGSQKGFCGNFNGTLFNAIQEMLKKESTPYACIAVGPYAYEFCKNKNFNLIHDKINYSLINIAEKTDAIFTLLVKLKKNYDSVIVMGNYNASIFLQKPQKTIFPLYYTAQENLSTAVFAYEQPLLEIAEYLGNITLKNKIFQLLLESLRAENSARALSMDSSTRNAKNLLTQMQLEYNKLRQAKVTKELTELSSSLLN